MSLSRFPVALAVLVSALLAAPALAQTVNVANAWARATAPGQKNGVVYVELTSERDAALVAAGSPLAGRVELHATRMEGEIMRMRPLSRLELPAGQTVKLAPNGTHLMLVDLKQPLKAGEKIPVVLTIQPSGTSLVTLNVEAEVRAAAPSHRH